MSSEATGCAALSSRRICDLRVAAAMQRAGIRLLWRCPNCNVNAAPDVFAPVCLNETISSPVVENTITRAIPRPCRLPVRARMFVQSHYVHLRMN
mmetsp:Transcript_133380/g.371859  ORF Transcript_133380/g.371859 Transcript_133380/m.371859 type:complete len:95 (+) Transcript_133380:344-628(+)